MKPEKRRLIHDLFEAGDGAARREATLLAGRRVLRHRRWRRVASQILPVVALALTVVFLHLRSGAPAPKALVALHPVAPAVVSLTDDQLLALFPNTPVALAKVGNREVLIFPRPEDRARFVGQF
jgi:peptidoglycan/LPS O-acetylase OafA/YrhL